MECNKEEAVRAKGIAEKKMLDKDFNGARKFVLKAQKLFPDLDNVSQMQTVCDVHLAAEVKVNGQMDWYGILQVMQNADDITIKKQYRRLALLLHPDKNKFGGAEAAFKLVGEAHKTLTDRAKRVLHDMKIRSISRSVSAVQPAPHPNKTSYTKEQPEAAGTFSNTTSAQFNVFNQQQPAPFSSNQTFWTICPSCGVRYQYYKKILNKSLHCQSCRKPFVAYDLNEYAMPSAAPLNPTGAHGQEDQIPTCHYAGHQRNFDSRITSEGIAKSRSNNPSNNLKEDVKDFGADTGKVKPPSGNRCQKRGRKIAVESSESKCSVCNRVVDDGNPPAENSGTAGNYQQKSARQKQSTSYNEEKNADDDLLSPNKKSRTELNGLKSWGDVNDANAQTSEAAVATCEKDRKLEEGASSTSLANGLQGRQQGRNDIEQALNAGASSKANGGIDFSSGVSQDPDPLSFPDPEFCDFEKERDESNFAVDQIWAIYDNLDGMPRYYALIRRVYGPKFKLRFTWLEYDPTGKAETIWFEGGLPIGCGSFRLGKSKHTDERLMFSHLMPWSKGTRKNTYKILPRKWEVWALFKNWDIEWSSCVDKDMHYEYEIVEVLSDLTEGDAICVVRLVKIHGFVSLFVQSSDKGSSPLTIPMKEILRFSHKIPSYRLNGNEREGIPKGSLELDCASLPSNFAEMFSSVTFDSFKEGVEDLDNKCNDINLDSAINKEAVPTSTANKSVSESWDVSNDRGEATCKEEPYHPVMTKNAAIGSENRPEEENADYYEYPESEFYTFAEERSASKFEVGQIWALYSDIDKYPNYYGLISKVELDRFSVHVTWLAACAEEDRERHWLDEPLPVGCGTFKIIRDTSIYDATDTFSHIVHANPTVRKDHYVIYPRVGEIWAVYKNWSLEWSISELDNCEYDIVEILDAYDSGFIVLVLSKVNGYRAVFRGDGSGAFAKTMNIPLAERLKFSHKIPAFRLTEERGGKLRGHWELDPASVPELFLFTNSD